MIHNYYIGENDKGYFIRADEKPLFLEASKSWQIAGGTKIEEN